MSNVTRILSQIESGDPSAAEKLLPLVYEELRKQAAVRLTHEKPGQTLQATALVHDAYIRLVDVEKARHWDSRGHFFAAAAEAMRRIIVESVRRKNRDKHGGQWSRSDRDLDGLVAAETADPLEVLAVHEALDRLAERSSRKAELVKLRYFVGCTLSEAAEILGISHATAEEDWTYVRTWLRRESSGKVRVLGPGPAFLVVLPQFWIHHKESYCFAWRVYRGPCIQLFTVQTANESRRPQRWTGALRSNSGMHPTATNSCLYP